MEISMVAAFGKFVAVGMACVGEGIPCVIPGLGTYTRAMLDSAGVAGGAELNVQLETSNTQRNIYFE